MVGGQCCHPWLDRDDIDIDASWIVGLEHERGVGLASAQQPGVLPQVHGDRLGGHRGKDVLQQAPVVVRLDREEQAAMRCRGSHRAASRRVE